MHLIACFGSAEAVYAASRDELIEVAELRADLADSIARKSCHREAEQEAVFCRRNGIHVIPSTSEYYPRLLLECNDYPHVLYYRGDTEALGRRMLSVVGTRTLTSYGQKVCDKLIAGLADIAPDTVIVSGLAFGADAAAHRAALASGLTTIGVLATPVTEITPAQHATLAAEMMKRGGGLFSEYHSQSKIKGVTFVPRNRLIAGMSAGTVVIESGFKGGSLITAEMSEGYNRITMAVPGRVGDASSEGTNNLIKNRRALMVCSADDIVRELGWSVRHKPTEEDMRKYELLSAGARKLLDIIGSGEATAIDDLAERSEMPVSELASLILELEFENLIRVLPGKMYERM
jgi:DNA processing protein